MSVQQRGRSDEEGQMKAIATRLRNSGDVSADGQHVWLKRNEM